MKNFIVTEIHLPTALFRIGLLKYFDPHELQFHIPDFCYESLITYSDQTLHDRGFAKRMREQGMLRVVGLNEAQMSRHLVLYQQLKPKFVSKTIAALVVAETTGFQLITANDLLRDVAGRDLTLSAHDHEWLLIDLVHEISVRGIPLDIELVKELL